jgi:hypothetical protein
MGKLNNLTEGVFTTIVETQKKKSMYDMFIENIGTTHHSPRLTELVSEYSDVIQRNKDLFENLALMEELIIQLKQRENIKNLKLYMVRDYIYARASFYNINSKVNDVRVIVDRIDIYPNKTIEDLSMDKDFMDKVLNKIKQIMDRDIQNKLKKLTFVEV